MTFLNPFALMNLCRGLLSIVLGNKSKRVSVTQKLSTFKLKREDSPRTKRTSSFLPIANDNNTHSTDHLHTQCITSSAVSTSTTTSTTTSTSTATNCSNSSNTEQLLDCNSTSSDLEIDTSCHELKPNHPEETEIDGFDNSRLSCSKLADLHPSETGSKTSKTTNNQVSSFSKIFMVFFTM